MGETYTPVNPNTLRVDTTHTQMVTRERLVRQRRDLVSQIAMLQTRLNRLDSMLGMLPKEGGR